MQRHTRIYLRYFKYGEQDFIPCEHCGGRAVDIHHIKLRSQGGRDEIKNLMALCRKCHEMAHNGELTERDLSFLHRRKMAGATTKEFGKHA